MQSFHTSFVCNLIFLSISFFFYLSLGIVLFHDNVNWCVCVCVCVCQKVFCYFSLTGNMVAFPIYTFIFSCFRKLSCIISLTVSSPNFSKKTLLLLESSGLIFLFSVPLSGKLT